jgi:hypothetical protein
MCKKIFTIILSIALAGCASNPTITRSGACTTVKRSDYPTPVVVKTDKIKSINVLMEFPAERFEDISLVIPGNLSNLGVVGMYLLRKEGSFPNYGKCEPTSHKRLACALHGPKDSGFSVSLVAGLEADSIKVLKAAEDYWNDVSSCK